MKKIKRVMNQMAMANIVATFALFFGVASTMSTCFYLFHQPEMPADMKSLRKF